MNNNQLLLYVLGWLQAVIILLLGVVAFWVKQFVSSTNKFIHQVIRLETLFENREKTCYKTHEWLDKQLEEQSRKTDEIKTVTDKTKKEVIKIKEHVKRT
jgi:hypothetical protein